MSIWSSIPGDDILASSENEYGYPEPPDDVYVDVAASGLTARIRLAAWTEDDSTDWEIYLTRDAARAVATALLEAVKESERRQ